MTLHNPLPLKLPERFDNDTVDAAKGVLILLVIFGHACNFWTPEPFITFSIKFFHVACFLLLPFIYDTRALNFTYLKDCFARYYIPFAAFLILYAVIFSVYQGNFNIGEWFTHLGKALAFGNAPMLDNSAGLRALWFMPALISVVLLNGLIIGRLQLPLWVLLPIGFALNASAGLVEDPTKYLLPFGFLSACYLLGLGIIIRTLCTAVPKSILQKFSLVFLGIAVSGIMAANHFDTIIKFPVIFLPDYTDIKALIIHDFIIVGMFMFLITTPIFKHIKILKWCGQNSLTLYLTHLLFLAASMTVALKYFDPSQVNLTSFSIVLTIFFSALLGGIFSSTLLNKMPILKNNIMPKSWTEWPIIKGFNK